MVRIHRGSTDYGDCTDDEDDNVSVTSAKRIEELNEQIKSLSSKLAKYENRRRRSSGKRSFQSSLPTTIGMATLRFVICLLFLIAFVVFYVILTDNLRAYHSPASGLASSRRELLQEVMDLTWQWSKCFATLFGVVILDFWNLMRPVLKHAVQRFMELNRVTKLYIAYTTCVFVILWLLRREIRRRKYFERSYTFVGSLYNKASTKYTIMVNDLKEKSTLLATILPHVLYLISISLFAYLLPEHFLHVTNGLIGLSTLFFIPWMKSALALSKLPQIRNQVIVAENTENDSSIISKFYDSFVNGGTEDQDHEQKTDPYKVIQEYELVHDVLYWLKYWTVVAAILTLEQFPVIGISIVRRIHHWRTMKVLFAIWLQLPGTNGANLAFRWIVPIINRYFKPVSISKSEKSESILGNVLLSSLEPETRAKILEVMDTSGTFIFLALPFFFMPVFTSLGCILFGLVRVVHASLVTVLAVEALHETAIIASKRRKQNRYVKHDLQSLSIMCTHWLEYWLVYPSCMYFFNEVIGYIPFSSYAHLLTILWLQIPFFQKSPITIVDALIVKASDLLK